MDYEVSWSPESIRESFVYSYRLIYRIEGSEVLIAAVIHGKRLLDNMSDRFGTPSVSDDG